MRRHLHLPDTWQRGLDLARGRAVQKAVQLAYRLVEQGQDLAGRELQIGLEKRTRGCESIEGKQSVPTFGTSRMSFKACLEESLGSSSQSTSSCSVTSITLRLFNQADILWLLLGSA